MKPNEDHIKEIANLRNQVSNEIDFKIIELYCKEIAPKKTNNFIKSPLFPIILSAFFAILGTGIGAWLQGRSNLELERQNMSQVLF